MKNVILTDTGDLLWVVLGCVVFLLIISVIYWLTDKPKQPRSEYTLPPIRPYGPVESHQIFYEPPAVIDTTDLGAKDKLTKLD